MPPPPHVVFMFWMPLRVFFLFVLFFKKRLCAPDQHVLYSTIFRWMRSRCNRTVDVLTLWKQSETRCPVEKTSRKAKYTLRHSFFLPVS